MACGSSGTSEFNPPLDDLKSGEAGLQDPPPTFDDAASGTLNDDGGTGGIPDDGGLKACATEQQQATLLPLDLYIMQDTSGSMSDPASGSTSKYDAVRTAMNAFVNDPASAGMGVGLQFFPQFKPGAPATCTTATSCGAFGPCNIHVCVAAGPIKYCTQDSDCGAGVKCGDLGECAIGNTPCAKSGGQVVGCVNSTFCLGYASGYCTGRDSCTATDYSTPNVPIQLLPGVAAQITAAFNSKTPEGLTPSSAALQGAIDRAKAHALANPGHTVVAVLATDGLPTECDTNMNNIAAIAAAAYAGTPSIKTFVIGVFAQAEQAQATTNLNQISNAGGTGNAFIINTSQNVAQQFLAALNQIRGSALPCQYAVPMPESGTPDFGKVNVQFSRSNGTKSTIVYVSDVNGCDPNTGGWYYDVNPSSGTPTKILLCPASCNAVKADSQGKIDVLLGCKSITSTPK